MTRKRSKAGCDRCKLRRVRCDEKKPRCTNCARRVELCTYANAAAAPPASQRPEVDGKANEAACLAITPFLQRARNNMLGARQSLIYYQRHMLPWRLANMKDTWWDIAELTTVWDEPAIDALISAFSYSTLPRYGYMADDAKVAYFGLVDFGVRRIVRHGHEMAVSTLVWCSLLLGVCELSRTADMTVLLKHCKGSLQLLEAAPKREESEGELAIRKGLPGYLRAVLCAADQMLKPRAGLIAGAEGNVETVGFMSYESAATHLYSFISTFILPATSKMRPDWLGQPDPNLIASLLERWAYDFDKLNRRTLVPADSSWKRHFVQMHYAVAEALLLTVHDEWSADEFEGKLAFAVSECEDLITSLQETGQSLSTPFETFQPMGVLQPLFMAGMYSTHSGVGDKARTMLLSLSLTEGNWSSFAALRAIKETSVAAKSASEHAAEFTTTLDVKMRELALDSSDDATSSEEQTVGILRSYGYVRHGTLAALFVPVDATVKDVRDQMESFGEVPTGDLH